MITTSKRMLNKQSSISTNPKSWSITSKYETILVGDPLCGKSSYLNCLIAKEKKSNSPVMVSDKNNEFEFWLGKKSKRAIFVVKDTASQERFRSLTQSYYHKAQCVLLIFDIHNLESFYNLSKWYADIMNYCKKQDNKFAIVLMSLRRKKDEANFVEQHLIDTFLGEHTFIIDYCEIDLNKTDEDECNLKEPFEIILDYFLSLDESRIISTHYFDSNSAGGCRNDSFSSNETLINLKKSPYKELKFKDLDNDEDLDEIMNNKKCCH